MLGSHAGRKLPVRSPNTLGYMRLMMFTAIIIPYLFAQLFVAQVRPFGVSLEVPSDGHQSSAA